METEATAAKAADLTDPKAGLRAVAALRTHLESLELQQVEAALRAGLSWQEIAAALGVSRQAAHKRFAKKVDPTIPIPRRST